MIGRTNVIFGSGGSSGGSGGVTTVDLPTCPASISANPRNGTVTLSLTYSDTDFISGVEVRYKTESYPTSPTDGDGVTAEGAAMSIEITGLTNGTTYYLRVYLYREVDGVKYYQTDDTNARINFIPRAVEIMGITPMVEGADHIVLTESGTFTLTANAGTKIIVGSAGSDITGGYVAEYSLTDDVVNASCIATISSSKSSNASKLTIDSSTYGCGATVQIIQSKWGPIGGNGGGEGNDGTGAGGGGGGKYFSNTKKAAGNGGNNGGYGNFGGNGGYNRTLATDGASGARGSYCTNELGAGGGGGYAAGGGRGAYATYSGDDELTYADNGNPGTGIIVIEWNA